MNFILYILDHWERKYSHGLHEILQIIPYSFYYLKLKNPDIKPVIVIEYVLYSVLAVCMIHISELHPVDHPCQVLDKVQLALEASIY